MVRHHNPFALSPPRMAHPHQRASPARGASRMALDANSLGNGVPRFRSPEDGYPLRSHGWHAQKPTHMLSHPHARPPALRLTALANARLTACLPVPSPSAASARCARQLSVASSTQSASVPTASPGPRSPRRSHLHLPEAQALRQQPPPLVGRSLPPSRNPKRMDDPEIVRVFAPVHAVQVISAWKANSRGRARLTWLGGARAE